MSSPVKQFDIKKEAENNLYFFAKLVGPGRLYGKVHEKVFKFLQKSGPKMKNDQLILLPRGHLKSHCLAVWCAWWIAKNPTTTILYTSGTEDLAIQQLSAIKMMLESDIFNRYWPGYINPEEGRRSEWSAKNIKLDHPDRKAFGVRDRTVAARSIDSNITGLHADVIILDDIVVPDNAYTMIGREKVRAGYSQLSSIANPDCLTKAVGTRYHGEDIYGMMIDMEEEVFDENGNILGTTRTYDVMTDVVEDGGEFLWPRSQEPISKKWFGFNVGVLAKIRAKYITSGERTQYYAQYYNNPQVLNDDGLTSDKFQYYHRKYLREESGSFYFKDEALSVFAGGDLAFTEGKSSDYTAFGVIGISQSGNIYILELDQFRTSKYERMYQAVERLHDKWGFRKIRIETNAGANLVAEYLRDRVREEGRALVVEGKQAKGDKVERAGAILLPRYENNTIWHYQGGIIGVYEEQVILPRPQHDDLRDAISIAVEISSVPKRKRVSGGQTRGNVISINKRFGGRVG